MSVSFKYSVAAEEALKKLHDDINRDTPCGICGNKGATVAWRTPKSRAVHVECYESIKPLAIRMAEVVNTFRVLDRSDVHWVALRAVEQVIDSESLSSYLSRNGIEALMNLFNTVGVDAVRAAADSHKK